MTLESFAARPLAASDHGGVKAALGATLGMATGFGSLALTSVFIGPLGTEFGWSKSELSLCYTLAAVGMAIGGCRLGTYFGSHRHPLPALHRWGLHRPAVADHVAGDGPLAVLCREPDARRCGVRLPLCAAGLGGGRMVREPARAGDGDRHRRRRARTGRDALCRGELHLGCRLAGGFLSRRRWRARPAVARRRAGKAAGPGCRRRVPQCRRPRPVRHLAAPPG
ncbi:hypothetical protein QW131_18035 [Roseibium salinum]|nr:hypothetical protein [Roseibium salinum]